ncbi:DUF397 domain-containing protein [Streptomyces sp. NPDC000594]|uniref:DUF397 domain-containing protein n=1 Tax=Streptomyces sp. NPDC000594 TaxID=3154261 RepID=UPI00332B0A89
MALPPEGWHKSTYSTEFEDACVEAARAVSHGVLVRDTKDRGRRPFTVSSPAWHAFLGALGTDGM